MIVPGDLEGSCNEVASLWSVESKTYRSICYHGSWITVTLKVKLMLLLIVDATRDEIVVPECFCNMFPNMWSVKDRAYAYICYNWSKGTVED